MKRQNCLVLDIETAPILAYVWGLIDQYIAPAQIIKDWYIMAWSAKWLEEPKSLVYFDTRKSPGKDLAILKPLWKLLNEADIVITQNGQKFDAKKINARFMLHGLPPPKPFKHLDTYQIVKKVAAFTSNKLEYLTDKLCVDNVKSKHSKYGGMSLWLECIKGNVEAWNEMKKYNIQDVLSTEELYLKIRAWAPESMPKVFDTTDSSSECGTCGYKGRMRLGRARKAKKKKYRQNMCPKCGTWQVAEEIK